MRKRPINVAHEWPLRLVWPVRFVPFTLSGDTTELANDYRGAVDFLARAASSGAPIPLTEVVDSLGEFFAHRHATLGAEGLEHWRAEAN